MKSIAIVCASLVAGAAIIAGAATLPSNAAHSGLQKERQYPYHYDNVLGTSLELIVQASSEAAADRAEAAVLEEISREAKILSAWDAQSEFSRWAKSNGRPVSVAPELIETLSLFDTWRDRTNGALDGAAETVVQVWKQAAAQHRMPTKSELNAAIKLVGRKHWSVDVAAGTATHLTLAPLALNSFAKIYIVNHAADAALQTGASGVVVNVGGDIVVRGAITEKVDVADPRADAENDTPIARLNVSDLAVATSGNYRRGFDINGKHFSHIVDPRTGMPADDILSATVIAPTATDAGALATAFTIMKPAESALLASTMPGVEFLLLDSKGVKTQSAGWNRLVAPFPAATAAAPPSPDDAWDPSMEVLFDVEIKQPSGFAKRPYVAVWIEDKDKFPIRTVALWYDRDRWLPELRAWYRDERIRSASEGSQMSSSISSATRPAGKYTVKWDGKDSAGKYVKPGKYTLILEASREHGPYQLMRGELEVTNSPKQITLTGNSDIATASVEYRKAEKR